MAQSSAAGHVPRADATVASAPNDFVSQDVSARCESSSGNTPLRGSYAAVTRVPDVSTVPDVHVPSTGENALPNRPLSVSFQPRYFLPASDVFDALSNADLDSSDVSCVQRLSSGTIVLTF